MKTTKSTTLLIMAAGIGSRFGTGIKQLEPVVHSAEPSGLRCVSERTLCGA